MKKEYDDIIDQRYKEVAEGCGLSSTSTMLDETIRNLETEAIILSVGELLKLKKQGNSFGPFTIMDAGCGNGYTLSQLVEKYPYENYVGVEKSNELRALTLSRFQGNERVKILEGDIRDKGFAGENVADILICQRVLINLLDLEDQKKALENIVLSVQSPGTGQSGGALLFIECFNNPLSRLNEARSEFELPAIPPAPYNFYLPDDFFAIPPLIPMDMADRVPPPNFLSTHYFVTRVLNPILSPKDKPFKRNSQFAQFFTSALNKNVGDYSPLKFYLYEKVG